MYSPSMAKQLPKVWQQSTGSGTIETQAGAARTSAAGTDSGAAGSSTGVPQLINQFQQMTISPHLVRSVTFLQNTIQPDYLERVGLVDKCSLDYLGVIDSGLAKVWCMTHEARRRAAAEGDLLASANRLRGGGG